LKFYDLAAKATAAFNQAFKLCREPGRCQGCKAYIIKGVGRKISRGGPTKKQDRKIAPLSLPLIYRYHV